MHICLFLCGRYIMKNAWSFTQKLTQNLSQSIWSIQLDDLLNYGRWEANSISLLSCVTQIWQIWYLEHFSAHKYFLCDTNISRLVLGLFYHNSTSLKWRIITHFSYFLQKYKYFKLLIKKRVSFSMHLLQKYR